MGDLLQSSRVCFEPPDQCSAEPFCLSPEVSRLIEQATQQGNAAQTEQLPIEPEMSTEVCPTLDSYDETMDYYQDSSDWCYDPKGWWGMFNSHEDEDGNKAACFRTTVEDNVNDDGEWAECCVYPDNHVSYSPDKTSPVEFGEEHEDGECNYDGGGLAGHFADDVWPWWTKPVTDTTDDFLDELYRGYGDMEECLMRGDPTVCF